MIFKPMQIRGLQTRRWFSMFKFPGTYPGLWCDGESWFRIALQSPGPISVTISFRNSDGDLDLYFLNEAGDVLASSSGTSNGEQVAFACLPSGSYYLKVVGYNGATNTYSLKIQTS